MFILKICTVNFNKNILYKNTVKHQCHLLTSSLSFFSSPKTEMLNSGASEVSSVPSSAENIKVVILSEVNFTNILRSAFSFKGFTHSFFCTYIIGFKVWTIFGTQILAQMRSWNVGEIDHRKENFTKGQIQCQCHKNNNLLTSLVNRLSNSCWSLSIFKVHSFKIMSIIYCLSEFKTTCLPILIKLRIT